MLNLMASNLADDYEFIPFTTSRPAKLDVVDNWGYAAMLRGGIRRLFLGIGITVAHVIQFPFVLIGRRIRIVQIQASDYQAFWEAALYALMARALGRKVVFRIGGAFDLFHFGSPSPIKRLISYALRLPHFVVAQSAGMRDYIRGAGRDGEIIVLPNWVRDEILSRERPESAGAPKFLFIAGSDAKRKGVEEVIEAIEILHTAGSPARFQLVAMLPVLVDRITALKTTNVETLEGLAPHVRILELMRGSDVLLIPSHGEGFPNSLIEGMAAGLAPIATPVGAVPEIVEDGAGLIVPVGDGAALARAIAEMASDEPLRRRMGQKARDVVRRRFVASAALPELAGVYRSLLGNMSPAR